MGTCTQCVPRLCGTCGRGTCLWAGVCLPLYTGCTLRALAFIYTRLYPPRAPYAYAGESSLTLSVHTTHTRHLSLLSFILLNTYIQHIIPYVYLRRVGEIYYIIATRTALGNCNPRSCRSKGIASCRTAEAAPGLQFFQYRSENGCARRWRAGGSHRWTRAT